MSGLVVISVDGSNVIVVRGLTTILVEPGKAAAAAHARELLDCTLPVVICSSSMSSPLEQLTPAKRAQNILDLDSSERFIDPIASIYETTGTRAAWTDMLPSLSSPYSPASLARAVHDLLEGDDSLTFPIRSWDAESGDARVISHGALRWRRLIAPPEQPRPEVVETMVES